jgi:hypothetical protein
VVRDLHVEFRGIFGQETIESLVFDSYEDLLLTSTVGTKWHPQLAHLLSHLVESSPSTWTFFPEYVERATRIELAFSAWEGRSGECW